MLKLNLFLIAIIFILQVILVNRFSASGSEVSRLKHQAKILSTENQVLQRVILESKSLTNLTRQAAVMGLAPQRISFEKPDSAMASSYAN